MHTTLKLYVVVHFLNFACVTRIMLKRVFDPTQLDPVILVLFLAFYCVYFGCIDLSNFSRDSDHRSRIKLGSSYGAVFPPSSRAQKSGNEIHVSMLSTNHTFLQPWLSLHKAKYVLSQYPYDQAGTAGVVEEIFSHIFTRSTNRRLPQRKEKKQQEDA